MIKYVQPHVYILLFYIISRRVRSNNNNKAPETG